MRSRRTLVGANQRGDQCGTSAVGQPHLLAGDGVVPVGLAHGTGADRRDIGSQFGLRHRERPAGLTGGHGGQQPLLLFLGAVLADHVGDDEVGVDHPGDAHPPAREFFHAQRIDQQRLPQPAVFGRDHQAEQAHLLHLIDDRLRVGVGVLEFLRDRDDLLVDEFPDRRNDLGLDLGETEGLGQSRHPPILSNTAARPWPPPMHIVSKP